MQGYITDDVVGTTLSPSVKGIVVFETFFAVNIPHSVPHNLTACHPSSIYFAFNSAQLSTNAYSNLKKKILTSGCLL